MPSKSMIIVGAGVAGLCTGIYGQMNGYQTHIFEKENNSGGLLTTWKRKGYLIDLCIHWLVGSGPGIFLNRYWNEIGLLDAHQFYHHDCYEVYQGSDGRRLTLYCDPDRLEQHMLDLAPGDAAAIREFISGMRFGRDFNPPDLEKYEAGFWGWMKTIMGMMPKVKDLQKWQNVTIGQLAAGFKDPLLRDGINFMLEPDFSALYAFTTLGFVTKKQAGYPIGGSQPIVNTLENRYQQLGGNIEFRTTVKKIIVQNNVAVGIQLEDGREEYADVVISAVDGFTTIYNHLDGKYLDRKIQDRYASWKPTRPFMYASFGVAMEFPDVPVAAEANLFELETPVMIAGKQQTNIGLRFHQIDQNFAPSGKTVFSAAIRTDYDYWKPLATDRHKYEQEKEKVKLSFIKALEQIWPGITAKIEMCDLVTPLTFERYTNNLQGSISGWSLIPKQAGVNIPKTLPGLNNFWMVGQWVYPGGGLPAGVITAREVIWRQCRKDKKKFVNK